MWNVSSASPAAAPSLSTSENVISPMRRARLRIEQPELPREQIRCERRHDEPYAERHGHNREDVQQLCELLHYAAFRHEHANADHRHPVPRLHGPEDARDWGAACSRQRLDGRRGRQKSLTRRRLDVREQILVGRQPIEQLRMRFGVNPRGAQPCSVIEHRAKDPEEKREHDRDDEYAGHESERILQDAHRLRSVSLRGLCRGRHRVEGGQERCERDDLQRREKSSYGHHPFITREAVAGSQPADDGKLLRNIMSTGESDEVTRLLSEWRKGSAEAEERLMKVVQGELRKVAAGYLRREKPGHTLQPTAVVNEAYIRLMPQRGVRWQNRAHFYGIAAKMMRRVLVDHARRKRAAKREGFSGDPVTLSQVPDPAGGQDIDVLALHEALDELAALDPRQAEMVELRFFGGLKIDEVAAASDVSAATVKRELASATVWLRHKMRGR